LRHTRIYTGFNAGNLWGVDHQASFQWTTAPNPQTLTSFAGQYLAPFPWYHQLLLYGGYSKFKSAVPLDSMIQQGKAWQACLRYQIPIHPLFGNLLQQVACGYDFKRTNSELLFGGISFHGHFADINQFYFGYLVDYATCETKTSCNMEIVGAPFQITHDQNTAAYQTLRPFAKAKYAYGRIRASHMRPLLKNFIFRVMGAAQVTGWNLLASEQFPLGGWETVRGYEERAFNADSGLLGSVEIATKNLGFSCKDGLEFLGFVDAGCGWLHKTFPGQQKSEWLLGVGPGIRYHYGPHVVIRGDIGFPFHKIGLPRHGTHYYGGITASF
jgi:hemolysin activation/secretion protein